MVLSRIQTALEEGRRAANRHAAPAMKNADKVGWALLHFDDQADPDAGLERLMDLSARSKFRPIVVSNRFGPELVGRPQLILEFAPLDLRSERDYGDNADPARRYLCERLVHIIDVWRIVGCDWAGNRAADVRASARTFSPRLARLIAPDGTGALSSRDSPV